MTAIANAAATAPASPSWRQLALGAVALFYFNTLFTYSNRVSTFAIELEPRLSLEVLLGLGALALLRMNGKRLGTALELAIAAMVLLAGVVRYVDVTAPGVLGREFDAHADLPHLGNVGGMFWEAMPRGVALSIATGLVVVCALFLLLNLWALRALGRALEGRRLARAALLAACLAGLVFPFTGSGVARAGTQTWKEKPWDPWVGKVDPGVKRAAERRAFAEPFVALLGRHLAEYHAAAEASPLRLLSLVDSNLEGLRDPKSGELPHLFLVFLESYGVTLIEDPQHFPAIAPRYRSLEQSLRAQGFALRSSQVLSPTFGGGSWRAHATLLSGVRIENQHLYDLLVASKHKSLPHLLAAKGYRNIAAEPGIQKAWPAGNYFGFDRIYDAAGLDYQGKAMGWWRIPDQFTLYRLYTEELRSARQPLFAKASLIMSHIPYLPIPPYVEDWSRFDDDSAYLTSLPSVAANDFRDLGELSSRYVAAFVYELDVLEGFLLGFVPENALVIVCGDHQPPKLATHQNDSWAVPLHLISRRADLVEPFERYGFAEGLVPLAPSSFAMEEFLPAFLESFNSSTLRRDRHWPLKPAH